jgi:hypothetical protein
VLKATEDKVELITKGPRSGIWKMTRDGTVQFMRPALNVTSIGDESEAFYLRVYGAGDYVYHGADLGVLMTRGRMQSAERLLLDRAKLWNAGIKSQFVTAPLAPAHPELPADMTAGKWF